MTISKEPNAYLGLVGALLSLGITFGLHLTAEQIGGIMAVAAAAMGIIGRQMSMPMATVTAAGYTSDGIKALAKSNDAADVAAANAPKP